MVYIDSHCHVDLFDSPSQIVTEAESSGTYTIAVTNAPAVFWHSEQLAQGKKFVRAAVGMHPELVATHGGQLDQMWPLLERTRFVGEIGLDFVTTDSDVRRRQVEVFENILARCAEYGDKVLTIHSRRAAAGVIDAVGSGFPGVAILHWFSGSLRELRRAVDAGMYFSVNPAMARSVPGQTLIAHMPRDRVVTETDGPFVKMGEAPAHPRDVSEALRFLATAWRCSNEVATETVMANFLRMVGRF